MMKHVTFAFSRITNSDRWFQVLHKYRKVMYDGCRKMKEIEVVAAIIRKKAFASHLSAINGTKRKKAFASHLSAINGTKRKKPKKTKK